VFEDLPQGDAPSCDTAGIVGPVAGIVGAYMAQFALRILGGQALAGSFVSVDGRRGQVRERVFGRRDGCTLCHAGVPAALDRARYTQGCA
jgi:adenylyltransferase/sulfurtransferase